MASPRPTRENPEIRDFILRNVATNPGTIGSLTADRFGISRAAVSGYTRRLVTAGLLTATGSTKARRYTANPIAQAVAEITIDQSIQEDRVWREKMLPATNGLNKNIVDICQYGFTEMLNNVIDHSNSEIATLSLIRNYNSIDMLVKDEGIGIFNKIKEDFHLGDARTALLELSKGKLTSDRSNHTGEGIYFTSRMFSSFVIKSAHLSYSRSMRREDEWLIDIIDLEKYVKGTIVYMQISTDADWTSEEIFAKYQDEELNFSKTHIPITLGRYGDEQLVSRSQAKRILSRSEYFKEVMLDFQNIQNIGQAFTDEMFRVFPLNHPNIDIVALNASGKIIKMIERAVKNDDSIIYVIKESIVLVRSRLGLRSTI